MLARLASFARLALLLPLLAATAQPQDTSALLGRWIGTGDDNQGEKLLVEKDALVNGEDRIPYKVLSPGVLVLGGDDGQRVEYVVKGDTLTLTIEGYAYPYKRDGAAPPRPGGTPPQAGETPPQPGNPLAGRPAADPFVRPFRGDDLALELAGTAAQGYRGKLVFQGATYPAEATAQGNALRGRFQVGDQWFEFDAKLDGDKLDLASGGTTYHLVGPPLAPAAPDNPLAGPRGGQTPAAGGAAPPALSGVYAGSIARFEHPRGWFAFDMPEGWSVHQQGDTGMLLNPGLKETDTLDALVFLTWGRLEPADLNQPVAKIIEKHVPEMRQGLTQQGLTVGEPDGPVGTFQGKDVPGGVVTFKGQTPQGQQLQIWFGGIVKRDGWISVGAVVLADKEATYMPKVKRIFTTLEPKPPERNAKLEAALVGRSFSSSQHGRVTESALYATYTFAAGGAVTRRLMGNVASQPGLPGVSTDSERTGRYEVCGDVLYLYFDTGQEVGQVLQQDGQVAGIRIGSAEYR